MSGAAHSHESGEHLVAMVNDIGNYFRAQGREAAIAGIATHIQRYWTPRMRQKLNACLAQDNSGLDELSRAAIARLNEQAPAGSNRPGGDASR
jgi:formate dehydrogenase subunit delta